MRETIQAIADEESFNCYNDVTNIKLVVNKENASINRHSHSHGDL